MLPSLTFHCTGGQSLVLSSHHSRNSSSQLTSLLTVLVFLILQSLQAIRLIDLPLPHRYNFER
jgi:hypothetical protein